jgi:hypothetical protein
LRNDDVNVGPDYLLRKIAGATAITCANFDDEILSFLPAALGQACPE